MRGSRLTALFMAVLIASMTSVAPAVAKDPPSTPIYLDPSYSFAERAADLVARLTPQERAAQLTSSMAPAISPTENPLLTPRYAGQTTLNDAVAAGDTEFSPAGTSDMAVGSPLVFDPDGIAETVTLTQIGAGAGFASSLQADASAGDTTLTVRFPGFAFTVGRTIVIDPGPNEEYRVVASVGGGFTGPITITEPLSTSHPSGVTVQQIALPSTFEPALTHDYPAGTVIHVLAGLPSYGWWNEALHGPSAETTVSGSNAGALVNTTSYPIDQSMGASWDPNLMYRVATQIGDEAREVMRSNKFNLDFYSPTVNLERDPRWGRNDESYGEDPYLVNQIVNQFVNGMEGKDQNGNLLPEGSGFYKTLTTLKHYVGNNSEGYSSSDPNGRLNGSSDMDDRTLREYYAMPFRLITEDTQQGSIMSSYNEVNGTPSAASTYLNDTLMRQTFGFQGYFTGDCDAVSEITPRHNWEPEGFGRPLTGVESLAFALASGEDLECNAGYKGNNFYIGTNSQGGTVNAIGMHITTPNGLHTINDVDVSATRLFSARMKLGEFNPDSSVPWVVAARDRVPMGSWVNSNANNAITETPERLALAREAADKSIVLLKNDTTTRKDGSEGKLLPIPVPTSGEFKVLVVGAYADNGGFFLGGYSSFQQSAGQANMVTPYDGLQAAITAIDPDAQVDYMRGFTGTSSSAGNCCNTIDDSVLTAAADYDYVIFYAGMDQSVANGTTGREDRDRTSLLLPGLQGELIDQLALANPNTVAFMETIGPQDITSFEPDTAAILWSSFLGLRKGEAVADVLLGAVNPSGHTNAIWYQTVDQIPSIYDYTIRPVGDTGRTYMYYNGPLMYPFGHGLSYTTFAYSNLVLSSTSLDANDTVNVSVDVTNTGAVAGDEVVELYVATPDAPAALERPIKRLEGFQKVSLEPGETKTVTLPVAVPDLAFYEEAAAKWVVDNGTYEFQVSTSSADADIQLDATAQVTGTITPVPSVLTAKPRMDGSDLARGITARVLFPEGIVVDPGLTVAMNDDTLYGFKEIGQSVPFPKGMTLTYSSNRPSVVAVDADGTIHTVANGAATVTATATYHGVSASTSFAVRVLSDLTDLQVNGTTVAGFNPDITEYDVVLPDDVPPVPIVSAAAQTGDVEITQADAVPGVATITSTGPDGIVATYHINFARASQSDEFDSATLAPEWSFVREAPDNWSLTSDPGSMVITPQQGEIEGSGNNGQNILLQPALGDWTMSSKLTFSARPNAATQQGGIIAYADDDNFLKFGLEATSASNIRFNVTLEDNLRGNPITQTLTTVSANAILPDDNTIWLQMTKSGPYYTSSYSIDGDTWVPVWTTGATLNNVQAGLFAFNGNGTTTDLTVAFDDFQIDGTQAAPVTFEMLTNAVNAFSDKEGVANALVAKLDAAASANGTNTRDNQLTAFINLVNAQTGKALTAHEAEILIALANVLM